MEELSTEELLKEAERRVAEEDNSTETSLSTQESALQLQGAVQGIKSQIIDEASKKVNDKKLVDKHSSRLAKVGDEALKAEIEEEQLKVEDKNAQNKIEKQRIRNQLIQLRTEKKRLEAEQRQLLKEQKADHKKRNKDIKWEMYEKKLTKMGYTYVPNVLILCMLLVADGIVSFFDALGSISTAILKCLKWVIIFAIILSVIMFVPVTREWFLTLLKFK